MNRREMIVHLRFGADDYRCASWIDREKKTIRASNESREALFVRRPIVGMQTGSSLALLQ